MKIQKSKFLLYLGLAIPVIMIIAVFLSIYLPNFLVKPQYNFLYVKVSYSCLHSYYNEPYEIKDGKLIREFSSQITNKCKQNSHILIYNVESDESREITFEEGQELEIDPSYKSPDGFELFPKRGWKEKSLKNEFVIKRLDLAFDKNNNHYYFIFLGWIK